MKPSAYYEYQLTDLVELKSSLTDSIVKQENKLNCLKRAVGEVTSLITKHKEKKGSTVIMIPKELINIDEFDSSSEGVKWKSLVYKLLEKSNKPITTKQLVELGRVIFPTDFLNMKKCLGSVSNALHYWHREGKICKAKNDGRGFKYWLATKQLDNIIKPPQGFSMKKATA
jgi:hypothetical protein